MAIEKLLFIDTNIWLDFYRARTDAGIQLLSSVEKISDRLISTYQVEMEYKKNRQAVIVEEIKSLKSPESIQRPALFSDAKVAQTLNKNIQSAKERVKKMHEKMHQVLENPAQHDPVYKVCQRIFHQNSDLILTRKNALRRKIRNQALRRFLHGCPPRKKNDTSIGDAINWEWMVHCAFIKKAELVIVSRDADYGVSYDKSSYINDHLKHEFSERVSQKRKLILCSKLSDALKHFKVTVTQQEIAEEDLIIQSAQHAQPTISASSNLTEENPM